MVIRVVFEFADDDVFDGLSLTERHGIRSTDSLCDTN